MATIQEEEDPTLRRLVFTLLGLGALLVYFGVIYLLLAIAVRSASLSVLGIVAIIASVVLLYRLSRKFIRFVPR